MFIHEKKNYWVAIYHSGEGRFLALVGHPSFGDVTRKMRLLHQQAKNVRVVLEPGCAWLYLPVAISGGLIFLRPLCVICNNR